MKIDKSLCLIGTDPEFGIIDITNNKPISSIGIIPGTKNHPYELLEELGEGFSIQIDNVLAEACLPPVKPNEANLMWSNIEKFREFTNSILSSNLRLHSVASLAYSSDQLDNPTAQELGCSTDYNAWSLTANPRPNAKSNNRAIGCHWHLSYPDMNDETSIEWIKAMDLYCGVLSVILDSDTVRRKYYGKAGCFRISTKTVEYRTLSGFYTSSIELIQAVFNGINKAIDFVNEGRSFTDEEALDIQTCINTNDKALAYDLVSRYKLEEVLPKLLVIG